MKIIIATHDKNDQAISKPLKEAALEMGLDVEIIYTNYSLFGFKLPYFLTKFNRQNITGIPFKIAQAGLQKKFLRFINKNKPDILLVIKGKHIALETIDRIRQMSVKTANWFPDGMWNIGTLRHLVPHYDAFFVMDTNCDGVLRNEGNRNVYYLPMAAYCPNKNLSFGELMKEKIINISFVGTLGGHLEREEILSKIKDKGLKIWGTPEWGQSSLGANYQGFARGKEMLDVYKKSKIVVNIHVKNDATQGPNLRNFEAMISGAMVISDYKEGLARIFKDKKDIVYFHNPDELPGLVDKYLKDDNTRIAIAKSGYEIVKNGHTMINRLEEIIDKTL